MKASRSTLIWLTILGLLSGLLAYSLARWKTPPTNSAPSQPDLEWLRKEFRPTEAQLIAIAQLHADYAPICARHCVDIAQAETQLAAATRPDEQANALAELDRIKAVCAAATRAHLQAVAAVFSPEQGQRFLTLLEHKIAHGPQRAGAPDLSVHP